MHVMAKIHANMISRAQSYTLMGKGLIARVIIINTVKSGRCICIGGSTGSRFCVWYIFVITSFVNLVVVVISGWERMGGFLLERSFVLMPNELYTKPGKDMAAVDFAIAAGMMRA